MLPFGLLRASLPPVLSLKPAISSCMRLTSNSDGEWVAHSLPVTSSVEFFDSVESTSLPWFGSEVAHVKNDNEPSTHKNFLIVKHCPLVCWYVEGI